ncbi:hypothetical protein BZA70DRAFT_271543 [Myxozyma melibiosi]|uniref:DNL-type domain-containing protein n=1 Tax=Myxozyma melibiosi TaxID=54550 RepID=A0ABR1FCE5_9ASCO
MSALTRTVLRRTLLVPLGARSSLKGACQVGNLQPLISSVSQPRGSVRPLSSLFGNLISKSKKPPSEAEKDDDDDDIMGEINSAFSPEQLKAFEREEQPKSIYDDGNSPYEITTDKADPEFPTEEEIANANVPKGLETYFLRATCTSCGTRTAHFIAQHAYHQGTIILYCKNVACSRFSIFIDNLGIFPEREEREYALEEVMTETAEAIAQGNRGFTRDLVVEIRPPGPMAPEEFDEYVQEMEQEELKRAARREARERELSGEAQEEISEETEENLEEMEGLSDEMEGSLDQMEAYPIQMEGFASEFEGVPMEEFADQAEASSNEAAAEDNASELVDETAEIDESLAGKIFETGAIDEEMLSELLHGNVFETYAPDDEDVIEEFLAGFEGSDREALRLKIEEIFNGKVEEDVYDDLNDGWNMDGIDDIAEGSEKLFLQDESGNAGSQEPLFDFKSPTAVADLRKLTPEQTAAVFRIELEKYKARKGL